MRFLNFSDVLQHSLHDIINQINDIIVPFNEVEKVSSLVGFPVDAHGREIKNASSHTIDPRHPEFRNILRHICVALETTEKYSYIKSVAKYKAWLSQLLARAQSLVNKNIFTMLQGTYQHCMAPDIQRQLKTNIQHQHPIEAQCIYMKFRSLNVRVNELVDLFYVFSDDVAEAAMHEVIEGYSKIRCDLLTIYLNEHLTIMLNQAQSNVYTVVRQLFSTIFRIIQLETQLFDSLFRKPTSASVADTEDSETDAKALHIILECLTSIASRHLRPLIIRNASCEALCRVIVTLTEDITLQLQTSKFPKYIVTYVSDYVHLLLSDTRERLVYCANRHLRENVQLYSPLPSHLAYPDLLQQQENGEPQAVNGDIDVSGDNAIEAISATWYPPMKSTLLLLSQLFGSVNSTIFEDFSHHALTMCIEALIQGSRSIKKYRNALHADLFLIRHLLILREQLLPFNIQMHVTEKHLNFTTTNHAFLTMIMNSRNLLQLNASNPLYKMTKEGLPEIDEVQINVKNKLNSVLKSACEEFKDTAQNFMLLPLVSFVAKVSLFLGDVEIPLEGPASQLPEPAKSNLKSQSFMSADKIHAVLNKALETLVQQQNEFITYFQVLMLNYIHLLLYSQLYITNATTRLVISKSVTGEILVTIAKMVYYGFV